MARMSGLPAGGSTGRGAFGAGGHLGRVSRRGAHATRAKLKRSVHAWYRRPAPVTPGRRGPRPGHPAAIDAGHAVAASNPFPIMGQYK